MSAAAPARRAREVLSSALLFVQSTRSTSPLLTNAIGALAAASNALYRAESEALTEEAGVGLVRSAIDQLTLALGLIKQATPTDGAFELPAHSVARALAMLYPLSHTASRRRRDVMLEGALRDSEIAQLRRSATQASELAIGADRRRQAEARAVFEVDIGLASESNFYAGLTRDVSSGGVFVSTHEPAAAGSELTLFFVLPNGRPIEATGVVRWTRLTSADGGPGMGVAFSQLKSDDLAAISAYFGYRAPLFFEDQ